MTDTEMRPVPPLMNSAQARREAEIEAGRKRLIMKNGGLTEPTPPPPAPTFQGRPTIEAITPGAYTPPVEVTETEYRTAGLIIMDNEVPPQEIEAQVEPPVEVAPVEVAPAPKAKKGRKAKAQPVETSVETSVETPVETPVEPTVTAEPEQFDVEEFLRDAGI
jgi:hypothetical protein